MKNILTYERYGKQNMIKRTCLQVKDRFRVNKHAEVLLGRRGLGVYVPKVNKVRFGIGVFGGCLLISPLVPMGFVIGVPLILWGLK